MTYHNAPCCSDQVNRALSNATPQQQVQKVRSLFNACPAVLVGPARSIEAAGSKRLQFRGLSAQKERSGPCSTQLARYLFLNHETWRKPGIGQPAGLLLYVLRACPRQEFHKRLKLVCKLCGTQRFSSLRLLPVMLRRMLRYSSCSRCAENQTIPPHTDNDCKTKLAQTATPCLHPCAQGDAHWPLSLFRRISWWAKLLTQAFTDKMLSCLMTPVL